MLIARSPVRLSLAGGGTDLPAYYEQFGGSVLSTTINKHFYVFLEPLDDDAPLQISSSDFQTFYRHNGDEPLDASGELALPRAILQDFGITRGLSLFLASEVPPGTGLGSSSSVAVGIIKAISDALDQPLDRTALAERACHIEIEKLGAPIGKQDQYATAFGGLNWIEFNKDRVRVERLELSAETRGQLERNLMLFYTGCTRSASQILKETNELSKSRSPVVIDALHRVREMSWRIRDALTAGELRVFGELLHETWEQKKRYARSVSNDQIDEAYALARGAGALGGKIAGAGGGGFLMLYAEPEHQPAVGRVLEARKMRRMDYRFETHGAQVLMNPGVTLVAASQAAPLRNAAVTMTHNLTQIGPRPNVRLGALSR